MGNCPRGFGRYRSVEPLFAVGELIRSQFWRVADGDKEEGENYLEGSSSIPVRREAPPPLGRKRALHP